jgi:cellulose biosynthesis protein BcsQ
LYIVAFYSFRDGLGRTTALVNAGLDLAGRGRKVLLVDFDLESPDLTLYSRRSPPDNQPGLVEFVTAYRAKGLVAPDVGEFLYVSAFESASPEGGRLWVMPAGKIGAEYWRALAEIDWKTLYDREDGYLLFEDLRKQWQQLGPDYVLIDTHAGITPALGIPTRQLADAVVMLLHAQRRGGDGLDEVCRQIKEEPGLTGRKPIEQLFLATSSDGVDEDGTFYVADVGPFPRDTVISFPYDLLSGEESVQDELWYASRHLVNAVIKANYAQDRDGARALLCEIHADPKAKAVASNNGGASGPNYSDKLEEIVDHFAKDPEILAQAASCFYAAARYQLALQALNEAIALRPDSPQFLWQRASYHAGLGDTQAAVKDLLHLLDIEAPGLAEGSEAPPLTTSGSFALPKGFEGPPPPRRFSDYSDPLIDIWVQNRYEVSAFRRLRELAPDKIEEAKRKPAIVNMPSFIQERLDSQRLEVDRPFALIAGREWAQARDLLQPRLERTDAWTLQDALYLFMAWWGLGNEEKLRECGEKAAARFRASQAETINPPEKQMMALVFWKLGQREDANKLLDTIEQQGTWPEGILEIFSLWRLTHIPLEQFKEDCHELRMLFRRPNFAVPFLGDKPAHP